MSVELLQVIAEDGRPTTHAAPRLGDADLKKLYRVMVLTRLLDERALKLQNYFTQPFYIAEPYTKRPGATVSLTEALQTCRDILDGRYDALPVDAFYFKGGMAEIEANPKLAMPFGPVRLQSPPAEKSL